MRYPTPIISAPASWSAVDIYLPHPMKMERFGFEPQRSCKVTGIGYIGCGAKSKRKSARDPELLSVLGRSVYSYPLAQSRRTFANIDGNQECASDGNTNHFANRRIVLEVQAAEDSLFRAGMTILREYRG